MLKFKDLPEGTFFRVINADPTSFLSQDPNCRFKKQLGEKEGDWQNNAVWMWSDKEPYFSGKGTAINPEFEVQVLPQREHDQLVLEKQVSPAAFGY